MKYSRAEEKRKLKEKCIKEIVETKITRKKKDTQCNKTFKLKREKRRNVPYSVSKEPEINERI